MGIGVSISVAKFLDVSAGLQPGQFSVGSHEEIASLDDLDPIYKQLLDRPVACVLGLIGFDGASSTNRCGSTTRATPSC